VNPRGLHAVIWDFNGTLVDDVALAVRSINVELERRGLPPLAVGGYRELFGFPMAAYYRKLGFDLEVETMEGLADEFHADYLPGLPDCPLREGVAEILERMREAGVAQFVLSAMEEVTLKAAVRRLGIDRYFTGVYGRGDRLADSKVARGKELFQHFKIVAESALLIGDTDHDAEVACALGTSVALVAQGHQTAERLRGVGCPVFGTFHELGDALSLSAARAREA